MDCFSNRVRAPLVLLPMIVLTLSGAHAQATVYTYTGNAYTSFGDSLAIPGSYSAANAVSASLTFAEPIPPLTSDSTPPYFNRTPQAFTISDGRTTISNSSPNLNGYTLRLDTDASGHITQWYFGAYIFTGQMDDPANVAYVSTSHDDLHGNQDWGFTQTSLQGNYVQDVGNNTANPGTWLITVPEPTGMILFGEICVLLAAHLRRGRC